MYEITKLKNWKSIVSIFVFFSYFVAGPVFAKDIIGQVKFDEDNSAILVTNPLYWTKNVYSGTKSFFIYNPLSKVQFNLQIMNDKAGEALKLIDIAPDNKEAVISAIGEYQRSVISLQTSFNRFLNSKEVNFAWQEIADELLKHSNFTDDLLSVVSSNSAKSLLLDAKDNLEENLLNLLLQSGQTKEWIASMVDKVSEPEYAFEDLRLAERFIDLSDEARMMSKTYLSIIFSTAGDELFAEVDKRIEEKLADEDDMVLNDLSRLSGVRKR